MKPIEKIKKERIEKLERLEEMGVNPYPHDYEREDHAADLISEYEDLDDGEETDDEVNIAGRIMAARNMGQIAFMDLQDDSGEIQIFLKEDTLGDDFEIVDYLDKGDILGVKGFMFKTRKGEVSVHVEELELLTKSLLPPPEKYYGLKDKEKRYRKRYLDLMMNPEVKEVFRKRTEIVREIQDFLDEKGFIEVETPALQPVYGGANARPFITRHNTLDMDMYLRISDELYLKRLIIGGFEKVYEICKDFRNEGVDTSHNPEFTMIEWYEAYGDYERGMEMVEELVSHVAEEVTGSSIVEYQGEELDFSPPWKRMTMHEAIEKYAGFEVEDMSDKELRDYMKKHNIEFNQDDPRGILVANIFEEICEEEIIQPTFITEFPIETTPLCKQMRDGNGDYVERFEPYAMGMELGNAYTELNDPRMQKELFEAQREGDEEAHPMDEDFVEALEYGMPPTSGVGIGIDRLVMLLTDQPSIRDVILFPTLRPKE